MESYRVLVPKIISTTIQIQILSRAFFDSKQKNSITITNYGRSEVNEIFPHPNKLNQRG